MLTILEKVDLLQNAEMFREVRTQSLARVAGIAQETVFEAHQRLFSENETADSLFVLLEGEVALTRPGSEERRLTRLRVPGAMALFADQPQTETAIATQPVRALRIRQQELFDAMAEDFNITRGILRSLAALSTTLY
jgi:CRP-like cAMP-binding protein